MTLDTGNAFQSKRGTVNSPCSLCIKDWFKWIFTIFLSWPRRNINSPISGFRILHYFWGTAHGGYVPSKKRFRLVVLQMSADTTVQTVTLLKVNAERLLVTIPLRTITFLDFTYSPVLRTKHASKTGFVYVLWRKNGVANCSVRTVSNSNINHCPSDTTAAAVHQVKWILKPGINTILERISFDHLPTTYNTVRTHNRSTNTAFTVRANFPYITRTLEQSLKYSCQKTYRTVRENVTDQVRVQHIVTQFNSLL